MRKLTNFLLLSALAAVTLSSCLEEGESDNRRGSYGFFTVGQRNPMTNIYTLYCDNGGRIEPTIESVMSMTKSEKGLDAYERLYVEFLYHDTDVTTENDIQVVHNADMQYALVLPTGIAYPPSATVEIEKITDKDSICNITTIKDLWAYGGYINVGVYGPYYKERPTMSLYCDSVNTDFAHLRLCYNRHDSKNSLGSDTYYSSFRLQFLQPSIPGNDTVNVVLSADGVADKKIRIARRDFTRN